MSKGSVSFLLLALATGIAATITASQSWAYSTGSRTWVDWACDITGNLVCNTAPTGERFELTPEGKGLYHSGQPGREPEVKFMEGRADFPLKNNLVDRIGHIMCPSDTYFACKLEVWGLEHPRTSAIVRIDHKVDTPDIRGRWESRNVVVLSVKADGLTELSFVDVNSNYLVKFRDDVSGEFRATYDSQLRLINVERISAR